MCGNYSTAATLVLYLRHFETATESAPRHAGHSIERATFIERTTWSARCGKLEASKHVKGIFHIKPKQNVSKNVTTAVFN